MLYQRYWWKLAALTLSSFLGSQISWAEASDGSSLESKSASNIVADAAAEKGSGTDTDAKSSDVKDMNADAKASESDGKSSGGEAKSSTVEGQSTTAAGTNKKSEEKSIGGVFDPSLVAPDSQGAAWLREMRAARRIRGQNPTLALVLLKKAFADAIEANAPAKDRLNLALEIGEIQFHRWLPMEAIASYKRGEEIAVSENRKDWQAAFLCREGLAAGFAYANGLTSKKADPHLVLKALELRPGEPNVPTSFRAMCYEALAQIYLSNHDLPNAEKYIDLGIAECAQQGDEKARGDVLKCQKAVLMVKEGKLSAGLKSAVQLISQDQSNADHFGRRFKNALRAEDSTNKDVREKLRQLFAAKSFTALDTYVEQLRAKKETDSTGNLPEQIVYDTLDLESGESDSTWGQAIADAKAWVKENPKSAAAKILLGDLLVSYAWKARGSGYADTISVDGQRLFEDRLRQSLDALVSVPLEERPAAWYPVAQRAALGQGWSPTHYNQMVAEGLKKYPGCLSILKAKSYWLQPRWYGQEGEADKFVESEVAKKTGEESDVLYARFEWFLDEILGGVTSDKRFDYYRMKKGLETLCKRYPQSWKARAELFYIAVRIGDKQTAESVPKVGK